MRVGLRGYKPRKPWLVYMMSYRLHCWNTLAIITYSLSHSAVITHCSWRNLLRAYVVSCPVGSIHDSIGLQVSPCHRIVIFKLIMGISVCWSDKNSKAETRSRFTSYFLSPGYTFSLWNYTKHFIFSLWYEKFKNRRVRFRKSPRNICCNANFYICHCVDSGWKRLICE